MAIPKNVNNVTTGKIKRVPIFPSESGNLLCKASFGLNLNLQHTIQKKEENYKQQHFFRIVYLAANYR